MKNKTPAEFLADLGEKLDSQLGVDADLADILKKHLLVIHPANNAVASAQADIAKLAGKRARPPGNVDE